MGMRSYPSHPIYYFCPRSRVFCVPASLCGLWQEVKTHDDVVPAAAIQALANLEIIRGGMPTFDYHK